MMECGWDAGTGRRSNDGLVSEWLLRHGLRNHASDTKH